MPSSDSMYQPIYRLDSLDDKIVSTSRREHLRRLNDILHLSLERGDLPRARRAWATLARCKEFDCKTKWRTGLLLLSDDSSSSQHQHGSDRNVELLRKLMRYYPREQESILQEIILHLADSGKFREALDELDLYLPSFPYQENPVLHSYAGLLSLKLSTSSDTTFPDSSLLLEARKHFNRVLSIDPDNPVAKAFTEEVENQLARSNATTIKVSNDAPSDEEEMDVDNKDSSARGKRLRRATGEQ